MYRILTASKDTYITNKIINNAFRAKDSNVGQAGTLDLFKLYNETTITGSTHQKEISRLLIKFDYDQIKLMQDNAKIDINDSSFKTSIKLHDVYGGQTTPRDYHIILFPLAQEFEEGSGYDVANYSDIESTNFITASINAGSVVTWNSPGAAKSGSLGDSNIDIIVSGAIEGPGGTSTISLSPMQYFETGIEDLEIDITKIVSASVTDQISNYGFLIAYSGSYEDNSSSYFVKRFASRHAYNHTIRPKLIIQYDDSLHDYHEDMIFDVTSSLYLNNYHYDNLANILSGREASELINENCMVLKIESGSFKKTFNVSQALRGVNRLTGIYSSSFAISSFENLLRDHIVATGSLLFDEIWSSSDETVTYLSSSLTIKSNQRYAFNNYHQNILTTVTNLRSSYNSGDIVKLRVYSENRNRDIKFKKIPIAGKSQIYHNMHYRVKDFKTGDIIIPFDTKNNSTRLSTDASGMYFEFYADSLTPGRLYVFEFLIKKNGFDTIIKDTASKFRIV